MSTLAAVSNASADGSVFSYAAIYPEEAVSVAGNSTLYSRRSDAGRLIES